MCFRSSMCGDTECTSYGTDAMTSTNEKTLTKVSLVHANVLTDMTTY